MPLRLAAPFLLTGIVCLAATAQSHTATAPRVADTASSQAFVPGAPYTLSVVVTDSKGQPVLDLPASAFTLQDNGTALPLQAVHATARSAGRVLLVIDAVNTSFTEVAFERQQIAKYLTANDGVLAQPTAVAIISDTSVEQSMQFTTDGNALNAALEQKTVALRTLRRSAGFYGAQDRLDISLTALNRVLDAAATLPGHKSVLWISPGWPLLSGPGVQLSGRDEQQIYREVVSFTNKLHSGNVTLYSLNPLGTEENIGSTFYYRQFTGGLRKPSQAQLGNLGVQVLAEGSGGLVLNGNNSLVKLIQQSTADAASTYTVSFVPPPSEPGKDFQSLAIHLADTRLKARTTEGLYTATP